MLKFLPKLSDSIVEKGVLRSSTFRVSLFSSSKRQHNLYQRLQKCYEQRVSVIPVLDKWVAQVGEIRQQTLQLLITDFRKHRRFMPALQIAEWMSSSRKRYAITPELVAIQLDLLLKVHGLEQVEKYFNQLEDGSIDLPVYTALMNCYGEAKFLEKAEATMEHIRKFDSSSVLPYNILLRLYYVKQKHDQLDALVQQMQDEGIVYDKITHKILLNAYTRYDLEQMEKLLVKMELDGRFTVDFDSYATAAKGYLKAGAFDKAIVLLKKAESLIGVRASSTAYLSLITYYATMQRKEDVHRIWGLLPEVAKLYNNAYVSMISSLVKVDDLDGARKILEEWEGTSNTFDIQIPNLVIRAYCKKGNVGDAAVMVKRLVDAGEEPNAQTLSHMALGYLKNGEMEKAAEMKKKAFLCNLRGWQPNLIVVGGCIEYLQNKGDAYGIKEMLVLLEKFSSLEGVKEIRRRFSDYYIPFFSSTVGCNELFPKAARLSFTEPGGCAKSGAMQTGPEHRLKRLVPRAQNIRNPFL